MEDENPPSSRRTLEPQVQVPAIPVQDMRRRAGRSKPPGMRKTTVNLDEHVRLRLEQHAAKSSVTLSQLINELLDEAQRQRAGATFASHVLDGTATNPASRVR